MKANELMTGDWVQFHHKGVEIVSETAPRCKTVDVDYVGQITRVYVDINDENGEFVVKTLPNKYEKEAGLYVMRGFVLNPVPLTAEILEKNGFEELTNEGESCASRFGRTPKPTGVWQYGFGWLDSVAYVPKRNFLRIKFMEGSTADIDDIKYVHELQHALRLFKVNKEIEL